MSNFQYIVLGTFGFFIIVGVLIFSGFVPGLKSQNANNLSGTAVVWGTIPESSMGNLLEDFNRDYKPTVAVYVEKNSATFDRELTEALASGAGPDIIMLPRDLIYRHADKVLRIPYASISERVFRDTFVQEGELYLTSTGILALPVRLDPMVMYFNRDSLSNAGISLPPKTWEEIVAMAPQLVVKDQSGNLIKSAVAFGEYSNVLYAKDIISLLAMQAGNKIVSRSGTGFRSVFSEGANTSLRPADEALRYYTNFSNPVQPVYSWDKSLPNSRDAFISGSLAFYFGYAGELFGIRSKNPHLNFDVAKVPQTEGASAGVTIGNIDGLAVLKTSKNPAVALYVAETMAGQDFSAKLAQKLFLPPSRRDLLSVKPTDAFMNVFFDSALMSRGWIDPSSPDTSNIFSELVENIVSGRMRVNEAVNNASSEIDKFFGN